MALDCCGCGLANVESPHGPRSRLQPKDPVRSTLTSFSLFLAHALVPGGLEQHRRRPPEERETTTAMALNGVRASLRFLVSSAEGAAAPGKTRPPAIRLSRFPLRSDAFVPGRGMVFASIPFPVVRDLCGKASNVCLTFDENMI